MFRRDLQQQLAALFDSNDPEDLDYGITVLAETVNAHGSCLVSPIMQLSKFSCEHLDVLIQKLNDETCNEHILSSLKILAVLGMLFVISFYVLNVYARYVIDTIYAGNLEPARLAAKNIFDCIIKFIADDKVDYKQRIQCVDCLSGLMKSGYYRKDCIKICLNSFHQTMLQPNQTAYLSTLLQHFGEVLRLNNDEYNTKIFDIIFIYIKYLSTLDQVDESTSWYVCNCMISCLSLGHPMSLHCLTKFINICDKFHMRNKYLSLKVIDCIVTKIDHIDLKKLISQSRLLRYTCECISLGQAALGCKILGVIIDKYQNFLDVLVQDDQFIKIIKGLQHEDSEINDRYFYPLISKIINSKIDQVKNCFMINQQFRWHHQRILYLGHSSSQSLWYSLPKDVFYYTLSFLDVRYDSEYCKTLNTQNKKFLININIFNQNANLKINISSLMEEQPDHEQLGQILANLVICDSLCVKHCKTT